MSRRFLTTRRPTLESLETRCNPSSIDPLAGLVAEPAAPVEEPAFLGTTAFKVVVDPAPTVAEDPIPSNSNAYFTNDYSLTTGADLSAFAGQTVRLRIAAVNNQGKLLVGVDNVQLTVGIGQDQIEQTGGITKFGSRRLTLQSDGAYAGALVVDPSNPNIAYSRPDLGRAIDIRASHLAGQAPAGHVKGTDGARLASQGFNGGVFVGSADLKSDGFDDIIVGAEANGHVKSVDGTSSRQESAVTISGPLTGRFVLTFNGASTTVSGRITAVVS